MARKTVKYSAAGLILAGLLAFGVLAGGHRGTTLPARLTAGEAAEDVKEFFSTLERVHPDITANIGTEGYRVLKLRTFEDIKAKLDGDNRIMVETFAYILYRSGAAIGDAHTGVTWCESDGEDQGRVFPPFLVDYIDGHFFVYSASDAGIEGLELSAVNGVPFVKYIEPALSRISGESFNWRARSFVRDQKFWWQFSGILKGSGKIGVSLADGSERFVERELEPVSRAGFAWLKIKHIWRDRDGLIRKLGPAARLKIFKKNKIAWLDYRKFISTSREEEKLAGIFKEIKTAGMESLVIDLRGNGGGYSPVAEFLLSHISGKGSALGSGVLVRLSPDRLKLLPYDPETAGKTGKNIFISSAKEKRNKPEDFFNGKVLLLIDNGTFSTASDFAAAFRDYGVGEIIGYESGGLPVSFGEMLPFQLKNSSITYTVSDNKHFNPRPRPGDDRHGVIPDILLNENVLRPYGGSVQDFVLDRILRERKVLAEKS